MPIPMQCECGHFWRASDRSVGQPMACAGCGETVIVGSAVGPGAGAGMAMALAGPAPVPMMAYGHAMARPEPPVPRGLAITGGVLGLLAGLGHAFIGAMLLLLAAFLAAFVNALVGDLPAGKDAMNEAYGILVLLIVYTGLSALSCIPAIMAIVGRYWAVLATAMFQAVLTLGMIYLTVRSGEWIVGTAAAFSGIATMFCLLGLPQAREHEEHRRRQLEGALHPPPGFG